MNNQERKIYIAGHNGMVGSAIKRLLEVKGYKNLVYRTSKELDLRKAEKVDEFFCEERPEIVIDAAAMVGGILHNESNKYEFLLNNMRIQNNLIEFSHKYDVSKFIFLGSSCIYPRDVIQPMKESYLLSDKLEPTNEGYALAKITGVKLIEFLREKYAKDYISLMPTNLYGPGDNYDLQKSHVIPALIKKFHLAKTNNEDQVVLWGTGKAIREFMHVDDLALATEYVLQQTLPMPLYNVGSGEEVSIKNLASIISAITGFKGQIVWDDSKPDGTPRKLMDSSMFFDLGWKPEIKLREGLVSTYNTFIENIKD